ncbi:MAG: trimethylamine methyltransferase family protein [Desulfobacterales bacterium]|jgi:trimethylamine--corrinoid protein Co-methyltransferase
MQLASSVRLLTKSKLTRIHETTVEILRDIGVSFKSERAREIFRKNGAKVDGDIVFISRKMLEDAIESAPPIFKWWARNEMSYVYMGEEQDLPHVSPTQGPIYIQDLDGGRRLGTLSDLVKLYKLCQASAVSDIIGAIPVAPSDVSKKERHLRITYELLRHVDKPLIGFVGERTEILDTFAMLEIALGRRGILHNRPYIGVSVNPLSPLRYDEEGCETLMTYAEYRQPVFTLSCAMAGVSAPVTLMGTLVIQNAEMLAGLVLTQLISPETPYVYSPASAVPNLATGAYVTGSPESNLINIAGLQLARELYELPCRSMAGLTDAHVIDCQAGYETMQNLMMLMLAGVHLINECLGALGSIMTTSFEKFVIDEEMIDRCLRMLKGLNASNEALAMDVIREVGHSGSYLMHPTTFRNCRNNWKPTVSFWGNFSEWEKKGQEDIVVRANRRYKSILASCPETLLDSEAEKALTDFIDKRLAQ